MVASYDMLATLTRLPRTLRVGSVSGGLTEFIDPQDAIDFAAGQGGDWTIILYGGNYAAGLDLSSAPGVNLVGADKDACIITVDDGETGIIMGEGCSVRGLTINVTVTGGTSIGIETGDVSCSIEECEFILDRTGGVIATAINENTGLAAKTIYIRNIRVRSLINTNISAIYIQQANKTVYIENSWIQGGDRGLRVSEVSTVHSDHNYWESLTGGSALSLEAAGAIHMHHDTLVGTVTRTDGVITYNNSPLHYEVFPGMDIQDALTAAAGGWVYLHAGAHTITNPAAPGDGLDVSANTKVTGDGKATIVTGPAGAANITDLFSLNGDDITLLDFSVVVGAGCGTAVARPNGVYAAARTGLIIRNIKVYGDQTVSDGNEIQQNGIILDSCDDCIVDSCETTNNGRNGIQLYNECTNVIVTACISYSNAVHGIALNNTNTDCHVLGNHCYSNTQYGIHAFINNFNCVINGNVCENNTRNGIYLWNNVALTVVGNSCNENDLAGTAYSGIQLASCHESTVTGNNCQSNGLYNIYLTASDRCTVSGNNVTNANTNDGIRLLNSDGCTVNGNMCENNSDAGIYVSGSLHCVVSENNCRDNGQDGIHEINSDGASITGNVCFSNGESGIQTSGDNSTCTGNTCNSNTLEGINSTSNDGVLNSNTCNDNTRYGISKIGGNATIVGNTCNNNDLAGNTYDGILCFSSYATVTGNQCDGNGRNGMRVFRCHHSTISANMCANNNTGDGIEVFGDGPTNADYNVITGNSCHDNAAYGIELLGGANANCNTLKANCCEGNATAPIFNGGTCTVGDITVQLVTSLDLSAGAADLDIFFASMPCAIISYTLQYTEASSGDAGVNVHIGRYQDGVALDVDYYDVSVSEVTQNRGYSKTFLTADLTVPEIAALDSVTAGTVGGKAGTGEVRVILELAENMS